MSWQLYGMWTIKIVTLEKKQQQRQGALHSWMLQIEKCMV